MAGGGSDAAFSWLANPAPRTQTAEIDCTILSSDGLAARDIGLITNKSVMEFLHTDDILRHLLCPISNKIPLAPAKSVDGITYDFDVIEAFLRDNPYTAAPGSQHVRHIRDVKFDFAHINTILERLKKLNSISVRTQNEIMLGNLQLINVRGDAAVCYIKVLHILAQRGELNLADAFYGSPKIRFLDHVKNKCSVDYMRGKQERLQAFHREMRLIRTQPMLTNEDRGRTMEQLTHLIITSGTMKKIWRQELPNQDNGFVAGCRDLFNISPYNYQIIAEMDESVMAIMPGGQGWARVFA